MRSLWLPLLMLCAAAAVRSAPEQGALRGRIVRELEGSQWALAEDAQGRIYSGGNNAVAVFDGEGWTQLPLPDAGEIRGMAVDAAGRVWIGSGAELGCFNRLVDGSFRFRSIREKLPVEHADYGQLWAVHVVEDAVFFVADQKVMRWREEAFTVWDLPSMRRLFSTGQGEDLLVHARSTTGVWRFGAKAAAPTLMIPAKETRTVLLGAAIIAMLPEANGRYLLFGATKGVYRFETGGHIVQAGWPSHDFFDTRQVEDVCRLPDGRIAIGTWRAGVVLTDASGKMLAQIDKESGGLPDNRINRVFLAVNGRLWIATRLGLVEWDLDPGVTYFTERNGFAGNPSGFVRFQGRLTSTGDLAVTKLKAAEQAEPARFVPMEFDHPLVFTAQPEVHGETLFVAEMDGISMIKSGRDEAKAPATFAGYSTGMKGVTGYAQLAPDKIVASSSSGIFSFQFVATGCEVFAQTPLPQCRQVVTEFGQPRSVVVRTSREEIWRVALPEPQFGAVPSRLPAGEKTLLLPRTSAREIHQLFPTDNQLYAYTANGTWRLTPGAAAFVQTEAALPDAWLWAGSATGSAAGWKLRRLTVRGALPGDSPIYALHRARSDAAVGWREDQAPVLLVNDLGLFRTAFAEPDGVLWLGGTRGIVRVDTAQLDFHPERALARPEWRTMRSRERRWPLDASGPLALSAGDVLEIAWCAPRADRFGATLFQTRLDDIDTEWSTPSPQSTLTLERLRAGHYTLSVRASSVLGQSSPARTLDFTIAPAWYQTWPARFAWLGLGVGTFSALVRLRTRQLRQRQRELETAVQRRTNELLATRDVLQQASHAKTEFISAVSHELRTPLAGARMMAEVLLRGALDPAAHTRVAKLSGCLHYLQTTLDETLDLSRLELGHVSYRLTRFRLGQLVGDTFAMFETIAAQKGLIYRCELGPWADLHYRAEATHLQRVLVNYLGNALKFTPRGTINLTVTAATGRSPSFETLRFTVTDTGPGVAPEVQARIFQAFVRHGDPHGQGDTPGTGLGLALCRGLADLSGGRVGFANSSDAGAAFWVEWPLLPVSADPEELAVGEVDLSPLRVLVVEDDPSQLEAMTLLVQELGGAAQGVRAVDEAELLLSRQPFDVVLVDYNLGGSTGMDLIARCRHLPGIKREATRFHLVTAHSSEAVRRSAQAAGFVGFHHKPISLPALYALLAEAVGQTPPPTHDSR